MATKYKQQADGRWKTRVWDGTLRDGKKHYVWLTSVKSSRDLERLVAEYQEKLDNGHIKVSQDIAIQDYAKQWLATEKGLSETATREMYRNVVEKHMQGFEDVTFEYWTRPAIQKIINENADKPRLCQQIVLTFKQISKSAERDRLLTSGKTLEIFDRIQAPKYKAKEKKPLTDEECSIVVNALRAHRFTPRAALFLSLIYFCGLRREEATALKYEDIHSVSVTINKALHLGDKATELKITKTERGNRVVPLPAEAIPIIQDALKELKPNADGFLFTLQTGDLITKNSYQKMWKTIVKHLGFECTAHVFRHTYCTRLCYEAFEHRTITVKQIAKLMGDTEKMVTDIYGHILEEKEDTEQALATVFCQPTVNQMSTNTHGKLGIVKHSV